jgi:hypothetical protein
VLLAASEIKIQYTRNGNNKTMVHAMKTVAEFQFYLTKRQCHITNNNAVYLSCIMKNLTDTNPIANPTILTLQQIKIVYARASIAMVAQIMHLPANL